MDLCIKYTIYITCPECYEELKPTGVGLTSNLSRIQKDLEKLGSRQVCPKCGYDFDVKISPKLQEDLEKLTPKKVPRKQEKPVIGQEAICPDGLGRVVAYDTTSSLRTYIQVDTYVKNRSCEWAPHNVKLINPTSQTRA